MSFIFRFLSYIYLNSTFPKTWKIITILSMFFCSQHTLCSYWYISNNYLSPCSPFKQHVSVVVTVGKQVLKTSSSGTTGLYEALIEQTSTQTERKTDKQNVQMQNAECSCTTSPNEYFYSLCSYAALLFIFREMHCINMVFYGFGAHSLFVNISPANSIMGQNTPWFIELSHTLSGLNRLRVCIFIYIYILHWIYEYYTLAKTEYLNTYAMMRICIWDSSFPELKSVWNCVGSHNSSALFWMTYGTAVQKDTSDRHFKAFRDICNK